jgi:hypothetical protein
MSTVGTKSRKRNVAQKGERRRKRGSLTRENLFRKRESRGRASAHLFMKKCQGEKSAPPETEEQSGQ